MVEALAEAELRERKRLKKRRKEKYRLECEQRGEACLEATKKHKRKHHDSIKPHRHHKHKHRHRRHKRKYNGAASAAGGDTGSNNTTRAAGDNYDGDNDNEEAGDENMTPPILSPHTHSPPPFQIIDKPQASATLAASSVQVPQLIVEEPAKQPANDRKTSTAGKVKKGRDRQGSVEGKSKMAAFLPARQLWKWSGRGFRRPGTKGRGRKEFFKSIHRENETISVGDCAVFLSTGRPDRPYIGRIESMWSSWTHNMVVKVKWFYHPEETVGCPEKLPYPGALFESSHNDENDVQTISHKCEVVSLSEYKKWLETDPTRIETVYDYNDIYFLAGHYDPTAVNLTFEPGVI